MKLPAHTLDKGPILVGGCKESCEAPKDAFRNFIRALFEVAPDGIPDWKTFIDTTTLDDNGRKLGRRWADLWMNQELEERNRQVAAWLAQYKTRVGTAAGAAEVEQALESGMDFRRISSELVEITFVTPPRAGQHNAERWTIRLGRRGLEWLVRSIYDGIDLQE